MTKVLGYMPEKERVGFAPPFASTSLTNVSKFQSTLARQRMINDENFLAILKILTNVSKKWIFCVTLQTEVQKCVD